MVSNISCGFREDCLHFLSNFASRESPYFETFCKEWRKANFQYIFCGWTTDVEKVEYTQEVLYIVKQCFLCSQRPLERIGALYLLYTLYMKQPMLSFCKIRVTLPQWQRFREIGNQPYDGQKIPQISAIVWKMFISEAFLFVQEEIQHGFDSFFVKKCNNNNMDDLARCAMRMEREITTMNASTGLCKALEILELGYNEMNEALQAPSAKERQTSNSSVGN
uniref:snRNA-activating protein complex subunit 1 n=1 Tax=Anopheles albimanus TaxID=7167 RepID=A0A182FLE7_ANOAL